MVTEKDFVKFTVSDEQWELGYQIGMARHKTKNKYESTRNLSKINTHVCGAVAEVVFGQWQGFPIDTSIHKTKGDKFDFISRCNETTDVKHSSFAGPDIELKEKVENIQKGKVKDIYVLCRAVISGRRVSGQRVKEVHVIGWISKEAYILDENEREPYVPDDERYPWNYVVGLDRLEAFVDKAYGKEVEPIETWG